MIANDQASRLIYRRQYYPNSFDVSSGQTIELGPGENAQADLTVGTVRGTRVFFSVVPTQPWVQVTLRSGSGDEVEAQLQRNIRTEGWILPSIPPGSWELKVHSNSNGQQLSGSTSIEVGDTDLRNIVVPLSTGVEIPVIFTGGSGGGTAVPPASIQLISSLAASLNGYSGGLAMNLKDNHLAIFGLPPGAYRAQVGSNGPTLPAIEPGQYTLLAVDDDGRDLIYKTPAVIRRYLAAGQSINFPRKSKEPTNITVQPRLP